MPDLRSSFRRSVANSGRERGIFTGVLRVVSAGGSVYRTVPGLSYMHTRVNRATPGKTAGDDATGGLVRVSVQVSDESWIPDSRMTAGRPLPLHRRYSLRPPPMAICPSKFPRTGAAFVRLVVVARAGVPGAKATRAAAIAMAAPLSGNRWAHVNARRWPRARPTSTGRILARASQARQGYLGVGANRDLERQLGQAARAAAAALVG